MIWDKKTISHEELISKAKLRDDRIVDRNFIKIEIIPKSNKIITRNKKDWELVVDENNTLPEWYVLDREKFDKLCWDAWRESIKINLLIGKEFGIFNDLFAFCVDNSKSKHRDNSTSEHWDNSTSKHWNNSTSTHRDFSVGHIYNKIKNHKILSKTAVLIDHRTNTIWVKKGAKVKEM